MGLVSIGHCPGVRPGMACSLVEHWLFSWACQLRAVSTPAFGREERGPRGQTSWARCWVLRTQMFLHLWAGRRLVSRHTASVICFAGGLGLVAVWVLGLFVF